MNRRHFLNMLYVAGAASAAGIVTAAPAEAAVPPAAAELVHFEQASDYTSVGRVNFQAFVGTFRISGDPFLEAFWGVKIHNLYRSARKVQYDNFRMRWIGTSYDPQQDHLRTWTLDPGERRVIWFGGKYPYLQGVSKVTAVGRLRHAGHPWTFPSLASIY